MINFAVSLLAGALVAILIGLAFGYPSVRILYGVVPGLLAAAGVYFYIARQIMRRVEAGMNSVQEVLQPRQVNPNKPPKPRIDDAVAILKGLHRWGRWQIFLAAQIDSQIGTLFYVAQRFEEAAPYLARGFSRNWAAMVMQAALHHRKKDWGKMKEVFEKAVMYSKNETLLWNAYAWCLLDSGDRDGAVKVLVRARQHVASDERTQKNLDALQNGKKMTMKPWAELWYQFHLEPMPQMQMQMPGRPMPRMSRRALFRGR